MYLIGGVHGYLCIKYLIHLKLRCEVKAKERALDDKVCNSKMSCQAVSDVLNGSKLRQIDKWIECDAKRQRKSKRVCFDAEVV